MWTLVMVYVTSHVIPQKSLKSKLLSTVCALKVLRLGDMLSLAMVEEFYPVGEQSTTSWAADQPFLGVTPQVLLQLRNGAVGLVAP